MEKSLKMCLQLHTWEQALMRLCAFIHQPTNVLKIFLSEPAKTISLSAPNIPLCCHNTLFSTFTCFSKESPKAGEQNSLFPLESLSLPSDASAQLSMRLWYQPTGISAGSVLQHLSHALKIARKMSAQPKSLPD